MDLEKGIPIAYINNKNIKELDGNLLFVNTDYIDDENRREITFPKGTKLKPLPIINLNGEKQNTRLFVSGPSGSGKSTFMVSFIKDMLKLNKEKKIYFISRLDDDDALNGLKSVIKINCNTDKILNYQFEDFKDSIVILDDFETVKSKDLLEHTYNLRDSLLECGRHINTSVIIVSHQLMNNYKTKLVHFESNLIVLFPKSNFFPIKNYLKTYVGNDPLLFEKIKKLSSRWLMYRKQYPQMMVHENGAFLM